MIITVIVGILLSTYYGLSVQDASQILTYLSLTTTGEDENTEARC